MNNSTTTPQTDLTFDPTPRTALLQSDSSVEPQPYFYVSILELPDESDITNTPRINEGTLTIKYTATEGTSDENAMQYLGVYTTDTKQDEVSVEVTFKNGTKKTYTGTVKNHSPFKGIPPVDYPVYACRPVVIEYAQTAMYFLAAMVDIYDTDSIGTASVSGNLITVSLTQGGSTTSKVTVITPVTAIDNTDTITQICLSGQTSYSFNYNAIVAAT